MKVLIISDTHGIRRSIKRIYETVGEVDMLIHCGDVCGDQEYIRELYKNAEIHMVAGNNDFGNDLPQYDEFQIGRYKAYVAHGHRHHVHYGTEEFEDFIKLYGYDFVFYGHTHCRDLTRYGGSYIVNPGSLALPRDNRTGTYMILQFDQDGKPYFNGCEFKDPASEDKRTWWDFLH